MVLGHQGLNYAFLPRWPFVPTFHIELNVREQWVDHDMAGLPRNFSVKHGRYVLIDSTGHYNC